jgi:hypothetical protein
MKITVKELKRLVYEAVAEARKNDDRSKKNKKKGAAPKTKRGPDGYLEDPVLDLSRPPSGGGRLKRQGAVVAPPVLTSEQKISVMIQGLVKEALKNKK